MNIIPNFVVLEGGDGSGTSTQMDFLRRRFTAAPPTSGGELRCKLHSTVEPTDGPLGKLIRQALGGKLPLQPETLARLFSEDRQEHLYGPGGIAEHCEQGELVVCDRYVLSSLVYQGITCKTELPMLLNRDFPGPGLLFFFDLDPDIAAKRLENRPEREIFEYRDFQVEVRQRYRELLPWYAGEGVRTVTIDASQSPEKVAADVWRELEKLPILKGEI
ncbi:dTMP kinase [Treponema primitia]|uniref:dTMP kinase n=1 Tax=Treponema primitia TaxID=88058 RepID=UPI0039807B57